MNLNIQFNARIIDRAREEGISVEVMGSALLILFALYEKRIDLLDRFDDSNKERRALLLYQTLNRKGLLEKTPEDEDEHYRLTEKGTILVQYIRAQYQEETQSTETDLSNTLLEAATTEDVKSWIKQYIKIFPEGKYSGRYLRTNEMECADRMRWFIKAFPYTRDMILSATRSYISAQSESKDGHTYTQNSSYFIFKGRNKHERTSGLATWCERAISGETEDISDISSKLV
jgi:hypothetical protein